MARNETDHKKPAKTEADAFDVEDVDQAPAPKTFERPKGLMTLDPEAAEPGRIDVKSGSATGHAPPLAPVHPEGAEVRTEKSMGVAKPAFHVPDAFDVRRDQEKRAASPAIQPLEGPVEVVRHQPEPRARPAPRALEAGDFQVVVDAHAKHPRSEKLKVSKPRKVLGIVDTTFARFNMGEAAADEIQKLGSDLEVLRRTVPGIKDLAVECKILLEEEDCDLVVACGTVGKEPVDKQCAHEASLAIQWAMLATNRHILEVFVHEDEAKDEAQLAWLMERRTREHAQNAHRLLLEPERLREQAGQGLRQGFDDAGPVRRA